MSEHNTIYLLWPDTKHNAEMQRRKYWLIVNAIDAGYRVCEIEDYADLPDRDQVVYCADYMTADGRAFELYDILKMRGNPLRRAEDLVYRIWRDKKFIVPRRTVDLWGTRFYWPFVRRW